jgi:hypothetical protein
MMICVSRTTYSQAFAEEKVVLEIDHPEIRIAFDGHIC